MPSTLGIMMSRLTRSGWKALNTSSAWRAACSIALAATIGLTSVTAGWAQTQYQQQPTQQQPTQEQPTAAQTGQQEAASLTGEQLEEVVVTTGYTMEKKKDVVGAVAVVDLTETKDRPVGNVLQDLQGQVAGVQILTDGNPGSGATVKIRGQGLGLLGFNAPLFIVDGVPLNTTTGLQELDPHDIDSIQVLRDAASASIYGARAANGVVVITTKRGTGHMDLSATASETIQSYSYDIHPLNTQQRALVWFQAAINSGIDVIMTAHITVPSLEPAAGLVISSVLVSVCLHAVTCDRISLRSSGLRPRVAAQCSPHERSDMRE